MIRSGCMNTALRFMRSTAALVLGTGVLLCTRPATAEHVSGAEGSTFATSMFGDERDALWPIDLEVEISPLDAPDDDHRVRRRVTITDGQWTSLSHVVETPQGLDQFELELTAHHHARSAIEIEYDLAVTETPYQRTTVADYVLYRLQLGPAPVLGKPALKAARADIVTTRGTPVLSTLTIGERRYEVRLSATRLRG